MAGAKKTNRQLRVPPAPKKKPQPKKREATKPKRRRPALNLVMSMSPLSKSLIPSLVHQGSAFPITGMSEYEIVTAGNFRWAIMVTNVGDAGTTGVVYAWNKNDTTPVAQLKHVFHLPLLGDTAENGGPSSSRAMKIGVNVITNTQILNRGGPVYFLNTSQRLVTPNSATLMTSSQWNDLYNTVITHPNRQKYDMCDFSEPRHFYGHVVDDPRYNDFDDFRGWLTPDEFFSHIATWPNSARADRPMSTLIFMTEVTSAIQLLTFSVRAMYYTRWPLNTVPGQSETDIPIASHTTVTKIHKQAVAHARGMAEGFAHQVAGKIGQAAVSRLARYAAPALRASLLA